MQTVCMFLLASFAETKLLAIIANGFYKWHSEVELDDSVCCFKLNNTKCRKKQDVTEHSHEGEIKMPRMLAFNILLRSCCCHKIYKGCNKNEKYFDALDKVDSDMK